LLSNTELYYSQNLIDDYRITILGDEAHHIREVMRHEINDNIFVTDGNGGIYNCLIELKSNKKIVCKVLNKYFKENCFSNITFCLPRLKNNDRFEFALEKSIELGITNFIVFESTRTIAKGEKLGRWNKIAISAMKQSLRAWLPRISFEKNLSSIIKYDSKKIFFDQNAMQTLSEFIHKSSSALLTEKHLFLFGPEGGFDEDEFKIAKNELRIRLTENRLRSETAITTVAAIISTYLK